MKENTVTLSNNVANVITLRELFKAQEFVN